MSVLGHRILRVGVDVRYRVIGVVVHAAATVVVALFRRSTGGGGGGGFVIGKGLLLLIALLLPRRLAGLILAPVLARVRDPIERNPLHGPIDHGHEVLERGAELLQVTGQHGYGVRGQTAPEPGARAHPVQRQPGTGDVQQQVRVRRWERDRCDQVS